MNLRRALCALVLVAVWSVTSTAEAGKPRHPPRSVLIPPPVPTIGFGTPAPYPYGWFGTQYRTRRIDQTGFYGYYYQYGYWQGYH